MLMFAYVCSASICSLCLEKCIQLVLLMLGTSNNSKNYVANAINPSISQECQSPPRFIPTLHQA